VVFSGWRQNSVCLEQGPIHGSGGGRFPQHDPNRPSQWDGYHFETFRWKKIRATNRAGNCMLEELRRKMF